MAISREVLLNLARAGATARVRELQEELDQIYRTFPDLRGNTRGRRPGRAAQQTAAGKPGRRSWSAADRKAAADRMRKYWAARRAKEGRK